MRYTVALVVALTGLSLALVFEKGHPADKVRLTETPRQRNGVNKRPAGHALSASSQAMKVSEVGASRMVAAPEAVVVEELELGVFPVKYDNSYDISAETLAALRESSDDDLEACLEWIFSNLQDSARHRALEEVAAWGAGKSSDSAIAWLERFSGQGELDGPVSVAFAALADADPRMAGDWLAANPSSASRDNLGILMDRWTAVDAAPAYRWTEEHLDDEMIVALLPNLILGFGDSEWTRMLLEPLAASAQRTGLEIAISVAESSDPSLAASLKEKFLK
jgi:hypothetical protein